MMIVCQIKRCQRKRIPLLVDTIKRMTDTIACPFQADNIKNVSHHS